MMIIIQLDALPIAARVHLCRYLLLLNFATETVKGVKHCLTVIKLMMSRTFVVLVVLV